jgi:hypothetical protein
MIVDRLTGLLRAGVILCATLMLAPAYGQTPSPSAVATAKELLAAKGGSSLYDPIVPGVVEQVKNLFLRTSPSLSKELTEVAAQLRSEYEGRKNQVLDELAKLYAERFTEQELKGALEFYQSPLGKKMLTEEPRILDESLKRVQNWGDQFANEVILKMRTEMKKRGHDL